MDIRVPKISVQLVGDIDLPANSVSKSLLELDATARNHASVLASLTTAPSNGALSAVFLRQAGGKTSFALSYAARTLQKLRMLRLVPSTVYPAPKTPTNIPNGIAAPGSPFTLPNYVSGPATSTAAVGEWNRNAGSGDELILNGSNLFDKQVPVLSGGQLYGTQVNGGDRVASVKLPAVGDWDFSLAWVMGNDGISSPVPLNKTRLDWVEDRFAVGREVLLHGHNLAHGNVAGASVYIALQTAGGGDATLVTGTTLTTRKAKFTAPSLPNGEYKLWAHNGHGGSYGWSRSRTVVIVGAQDDVHTRAFGNKTLLTLSDNDGQANVDTINNALLSGPGEYQLPAGQWPISNTLVPQSFTKLSCATPGQRTRLVATPTWSPDNRGMVGTNYAYMVWIDGIDFLNPNNVALSESESVVVFNNVDQLRLSNANVLWARPYSEQGGFPTLATPLRVKTSKHVYFDNVVMTGSGSFVGYSQQVFFTNCAHVGTNNADHLLYFANCEAYSVDGSHFSDLNPTSGDGVTRGSGRCIKQGGQEGRNQYWYLGNLVGTQLGPLFTGANPYFDDNQGEMLLTEGHKTTWQSKVTTAGGVTYNNPVVSATATSITFANPVPTGGNIQVGVVPNAHLLRIAKGKGLYQTRGIVSVSDNTIVVDEPFELVPDATSFVQVGLYTRGGIIENCTFTGKRSIVDSDRFCIQCGMNIFGGSSEITVDGLHVTDARNGFIFTCTTHEDGVIDGVFNCELLNSTFVGTRYGLVFQAPGHDQHLEWLYPACGLDSLLLRNNKLTSTVEDDLRFKLPRLSSEVAEHWAVPAYPPIGLVATSDMPVYTDFTNDYFTFTNNPAYPLVPVTDNAIRAFVQGNSLPAVANPELESATELGPLEELPGDAAIDASNGLLTFTSADELLLYYLNTAEEQIPLSRTF